MATATNLRAFPLVNLDLPELGFRGFRQDQGQYAICDTGFYPVRIDLTGQGKIAAEMTDVVFRVGRFEFLVVIEIDMALDRELPLLQFDIYIFFCSRRASPWPW